MQEQPCRQKTDQPAAGECAQPGEKHFAGSVPMDMAFRACCTHAENCRSLGVRRAYRNAKNRRQQQAERSRKVRCKALPGGKPHQTVSHFADDAPPAHRRTKPHRCGRKQHQPKRRLNGCHTGLPHGKGAAQQQNANELLPILRAMQKRGTRRGSPLCLPKKALRRLVQTALSATVPLRPTRSPSLRR